MWPFIRTITFRPTTIAATVGGMEPTSAAMIASVIRRYFRLMPFLFVLRWLLLRFLLP